MSVEYSDAVGVARDYYNSGDADNFYFRIWGGEDIHIGLYRDSNEPIAAASERTVRTMAEQIERPLRGAKVVDLGAGYGGSARWLAGHCGAEVACINLSEVQNDRNRRLNDQAGLDCEIDVLDASFEQIPLSDSVCDIVWSQDSFLHSGDRERVIAEVDRILKPGGEFIFTDPMQADDCAPTALQPVLDRLHLESLASIEFYREAARKRGWQEVSVRDLTPQLINHYSRVRNELRNRRDTLRESVSDGYIEQMIKGLGHWISAGQTGLLRWGILHFRKPALN